MSDGWVRLTEAQFAEAFEAIHEAWKKLQRHETDWTFKVMPHHQMLGAWRIEAWRYDGRSPAFEYEQMRWRQIT